MRATGGPAAALVLLLVPALAIAQAPDAPVPPDSDAARTSLADGPVSPWSGQTVRADGFSTRVNPASLVFIDGLHTGVAVRDADPGQDRAAVGWNLAAGFGDFLGLGTGIDNTPEATALTTGFGIGFDRVAMGFSGTRWFSDSDRALDGFRTSRVGLAVRATNNIGASLVLDDVTSPRLQGEPIPRSVLPGMAFRTTNGAFEVDMRYRAVVGQRDADTAGATVLARPIPGIRLFASTDVRVRAAADDVTAAFGLELSAGYVTTTGGVTVATGADGSADLGFVAAFEASTQPAPGFARHHRFVRVDLAGDFTEAPEYRLFKDAPPTFTDLLAELDAITRDPTIDGVFLNMGGVTASTGQLYELRQAVRAVQTSGRTVVAYFEQATVRDIYVAGGADVKLGPPTLSVLTTGLGITRAYFGELLERIGLRADFVRIGDFKSGPERFTRSEPSPPSNQQVDAYLDDVWSTLLAGVAEDRGTTPDEASDWLGDSPLSATELLAQGFLDAIAYRDELGERLEELVGHPVRVVAERHPAQRGEFWVDPNVIAVLHVDGPMVLGDSGGGLLGARTGSTTFARACAAIAEDPTIRGVIVRIDSPGGSALAADRMHRALSQLPDDLPVVVSMGDVAASGGMYAAAFGRTIHAVPTTLTGSIGIYAGTVSLEGLLDRVGVNRVRDERGGPSDLFDGRGWDDATREAVYEHIEHAYGLFLERVAAARGMTTEEVDAIGQGRIWSGADALDNGLVDGLGGFVAALDEVRTSAGIRATAPVTLRHYPAPEPSLLGLLPSMPRVGARAGLGWLEVAERLGLSPALPLLDALTSEPAGAAMAQLEWVLE